ncbi:MAG: hypothetical protein NT007_09595 [Candidatus Kapabacteria bacterium]|nr:hypothetical protein [Candidatus Kapabacteria bacterium]
MEIQIIAKDTPLDVLRGLENTVKWNNPMISIMRSTVISKLNEEIADLPRRKPNTKYDAIRQETNIPEFVWKIFNQIEWKKVPSTRILALLGAVYAEVPEAFLNMSQIQNSFRK